MLIAGLFLVAFALAAPPTVVGLAAFGLPPWAGAGLVAGAGALAAHRLRHRARVFADAVRSRRALLVVCFVAAVPATVQSLRVAHFMYDATRADRSLQPESEFSRRHSCLTSYTEAARLAPTGANVYDPAVYQDPRSKHPLRKRYLGPLEVDLYQYPPPFLALARLGTPFDFFTVRRAWFALQSLSLLGAFLALAAFIGGAAGRTVALLAPALWAWPPVLLTLQIGNFHVTAVAFGVLAMLAFARHRAGVTALGGLALGLVTVSKIFPGVLAIVLLVERRWRALAATVLASLAITLAALLLVGSQPFRDFFAYQLPRIASGDAFFWIERPSFALLNFSLYGLVTKLRGLGVPGTGRAAGTLAANVYGGLLLLLAGFAAVRHRALGAAAAGAPPGSASRLRQAQIWLALLTLASLRSPFVPSTYAVLATLWLLALLTAERHPWPVYTAMAAIAAVLAHGSDPRNPAVPLDILVVKLGAQLAFLAVNVWVIVRPTCERAPLPAAWLRPGALDVPASNDGAAAAPRS